MKRRVIFAFGLVGFFLMWGVFGFAAAAPHRAAGSPASVPNLETSIVVPEATNSAGIPVTGDPEPGWTEIVVFYGLIGVTALFLVFGLLKIANKSTAPYTPQEGPPSDHANLN